MNAEEMPRPVADREIASTLDGNDITRGYTGPLLIPADRVLRQRGGNDLAIYEQVLSEPQVHSTFQQRRNAVVKCEWQVDAASDRRADKKAADFVREQLRKVGFDQRTERMLYGVFYGYAVAEMLYGVEGGMIVWNAIKVRNRRRFRFTPKGELRMLTQDNMFDGVELPPHKFWSYSTGADHDDEPYGLGLGHWCYWPVLFKRNGIKFWLSFIEKFAAPTGVGKYDPGATDEERRKLLGAVRAIQSDSGIIIPKGMEIELLEAARAGTADYKSLHDTMDETIAKVTIGQTMTSEDGSSQAQAKVHMDVRQDLVRADADLVCESLNIGPVLWLTRWNFPDADPPRVSRVLDEPEDLTERADRDSKIATFGFKPTLRYVNETYGGEWVEVSPPAPVEVPPNGAPPIDLAAPGATPETTDQLAELLASEADAPMSEMVDQVRGLVDRAASLEEIRDELLTLWPKVKPDRFTKVMETALGIAVVAGRAEAADESRG